MVSKMCIEEDDSSSSEDRFVRGVEQGTCCHQTLVGSSSPCSQRSMSLSLSLSLSSNLDLEQTSKRRLFIRSLIREVAGFAPYEKRITELLKVGKDKTCSQGG
ncbi:hypothetical protein DY000_02056119 [Brassica cretica]|uniref:60S ribosomal protein L36 n=1 Tax=Brassica cretica TaxID=69181 RepID=A0ABQ7AHA5_BRACR|nr:hypothetical protein DY000_02056119 [Brassica cretica]